MASCQEFESQTYDENDLQKLCTAAKGQGHHRVFVCCKAYPQLRLDIINGEPGLLPKSTDPTQKWVKVILNGAEHLAIDNDGRALGRHCFLIVNTTNWHALAAKGDKVVFMKPESVDKSVLWTEIEDIRGGYKYIIAADSKVWTAEGVNIRLREIWNADGVKVTLPDCVNQNKHLWKMDDM